MKKRTFIMILGIWIAIVPILGLPSSWKSTIIIISGLAVALLAATRKASLVPKEVGVIEMPQTVKKPRKPRTIKVPVATQPEIIKSVSIEPQAEEIESKNKSELILE